MRGETIASGFPEWEEVTDHPGNVGDHRVGDVEAVHYTHLLLRDVPVQMLVPCRLSICLQESLNLRTRLPQPPLAWLP